LVIDHPYATPTQSGATTASAYFRGIRNRGQQSERLLGASTPLAERVILQRSGPPETGEPLRNVDAIDLPARNTVQLRHTGAYHLVLVGLRQPLKEGDRFDLTLVFERAGLHTVKVWVQTPRTSSSTHVH